MCIVHYGACNAIGAVLLQLSDKLHSLKDNIPHTCQIYVKPQIKNTQTTLESQIFDEKALR